MTPSAPRLKAHLDQLHDRYVTEAALAMDPLGLAQAYEKPLDQEVAAFVAAHLAYGRVAPMLKAIEALLAPLGPEPARWLREQSEAAVQARLTPAFAPWKWRFHTGPDMLHWLLAWRRLSLEGDGRGLEPHLLPADGQDADTRLSALVHRLRRELPATPGLRFNLPDPLEGAACKRWRMFLRWMVRSGWPDLGLWRDYPEEALVVPLDTHVARIGRFIGLGRRRTADGKLAQEITASLKKMCPEDPLRYDFPIAHLGILGDCPGRRSLPICAPCPLVDICRAGR